MAKLEILEFPDSRLRTVAKPVEVFDARLARLIEDMYATMYAAPGIGLAATQVNVHQRLLIADVSEDHDTPLTLINPVILEKSGTQISQEGCLSVPGTFADIERAEHIVVEACDVQGKSRVLEAKEMLAVCIQHEIDHLDGKLFVDYLSPLKRDMIRRKLDKQRRLAVGT